MLSIVLSHEMDSFKTMFFFYTINQKLSLSTPRSNKAQTFFFIYHQAGCIFVAALLHYLFLAAICWMLCEGVMLYLMLVVVFSKLSKKWWFFFLLGWGEHFQLNPWANILYVFKQLFWLCGRLQDKILSFLVGYHGKCNKICLYSAKCIQGHHAIYTVPILIFVTIWQHYLISFLVTPLPIVVIAAA